MKISFPPELTLRTFEPAPTFLEPTDKGAMSLESTAHGRAALTERSVGI